MNKILINTLQEQQTPLPAPAYLNLYSNSPHAGKRLVSGGAHNDEDIARRGRTAGAGALIKIEVDHNGDFRITTIKEFK